MSAQLPYANMHVAGSLGDASRKCFGMQICSVGQTLGAMESTPRKCKWDVACSFGFTVVNLCSVSS